MSTDTDIIAPISVQVRRVTALDDHDAVAAKLDICETLKQWTKQVCEEIEASALERIMEIGPVRVGGNLYWAGVTKKAPKCVNVGKAINALLDAERGDFDALVRHFGSQPIKYGTARAALTPEVYGELFKVEEVVELQCDEAGKALKKLQKAPAFMLEKKH